MVGGLLGARLEVSAGSWAEFVRVHSEGNPFLVEELLAGASGLPVNCGCVDWHWDQYGRAHPDRSG